jgi:high affinity Mn2+ porin
MPQTYCDGKGATLTSAPSFEWLGWPDRLDPVGGRIEYHEPVDGKGILLFLMLGGVAHAAADSPQVASGTSAEEGESAQRFAFHWQATYVEQETLGFYAPYSGPNSLSPRSGRETTDLTFLAGVRLWSGAELWVTPEIDQGSGLDDTLGVAGFPSGEAYKVGRNHPYLRLPRAFMRETLSLGDRTEAIEPGADQFAARRSPNYLVFSVGKLAVTDVFDTNRYAHDPRNDFLNWSVVDAGTFDYAADAWGYTVGAAAEWYQGVWTIRAGVFDLSNVPNSVHLEPGLDEFQMVAELERRHEVLGQPGRVLLTAFDSRGRMGLLDEAVDLARETGDPVNIAAVRRYRSRLGASLGLEQQLSPDLGMFVRVGKAAGNVEAYEFSDIDRTVAAGASLKGSSWHRPDDTVGLAGVVNGISATRERFLNAGGLGILVGDGQLPHPGLERILEAYYELSMFGQSHVTVDYQRVDNPGYNRDRGPVSIVAARVHVQF